MFGWWGINVAKFKRDKFDDLNQIYPIFEMDLLEILIVDKDG